MRILFVTLVLDGMPFLPLIWAELRKLPKEIKWEWSVSEGLALPMNCTKWCAKQEPRLSRDGTTQYMRALVELDDRVIHASNEAWAGKLAMVNTACQWGSDYNREFLLWQMDSDELWTADQIVRCHQMFLDHPEKNAAFFWCRYFVGPDKVIVTRNCFGNNPEYEWMRVWKIKPGMQFKTHEPPVIDGLKLNPFRHAETEVQGLVFEHLAYCTRAQVEFKEQYYAGPNNKKAAAYRGLTVRWEQFQAQMQWPRSLKEIMPWAGRNCMVEKI